MKKKISPNEMIKKLLAGDRRAAARMITLVEDEMDEHHEVMRQVYPHTGKAMILGITGAGGGRQKHTDGSPDSQVSRTREKGRCCCGGPKQSLFGRCPFGGPYPPSEPFTG